MILIYLGIKLDCIEQKKYTGKYIILRTHSPNLDISLNIIKNCDVVTDKVDLNPSH